MNFNFRAKIYGYKIQLKLQYNPSIMILLILNHPLVIPKINPNVKLPDIGRYGNVVIKKSIICVIILDDVANNFVKSIVIISIFIK